MIHLIGLPLIMLANSYNHTLGETLACLYAAIIIVKSAHDTIREHRAEGTS